MTEIPILSDTLSPRELHDLMLSEIGTDHSFSMKIQEEKEGHKDMSVAVAFVAGALPLMGVLATQVVTLLIEIYKQKAQLKMNKVVIKGKSGRSIEIPVDATDEEIEKYLALVKRLDEEEEGIKYIATIS